ncbi:hypothetical protein [Kitasatospora acidiphila]|uniref:hypothetical protein n=1 Tax=Kitasatospora acidiphila TaxID=2567942 RepID=UPI003C790A2C
MAHPARQPHPKRAAAVLLLTLLIALALPSSARADDRDHDRPEPSPIPAATACQTAEQLVGKGDLDEAKAILDALPRPGEAPCVVTVLAKLDQQRQYAAHEVLDGQSALQRGDRTTAETEFHQAQQADQTNADAIAGLADMARHQGDPLPTASSNWDYFYNDWVQPIWKLVLPIALGIVVLWALASFASRWLVPVNAIEWQPRQRRTMSWTGGLLLVGSAAMLPIKAIFRPFRPGSQLALAAALLALVLLVGSHLLMGYAIHRVTSPNGDDIDAKAAKWLPGLWRESKAAAWRREIRKWRLFSWLLLVLFAIGLAAGLTPYLVNNQHNQGLLSDAVLTLFGVLLTSAAWGQRLRLQVDVQRTDGATDAGATAYLLARMQSLGLGAPHSYAAPPSASPLSALSSSELSAIPAGRVAGSLARLYFTLRPDLTWRAIVTLLDPNRVTVLLSRNGRSVESMIVSRLDAGLPPVREDGTEAETSTSRERAQAQLLTGAAAFALVRLRQCHTDLRHGLYGATAWESVTLQVIATSKALIDDDTLAVQLLAQATERDPGYVLARFEYLWAVNDRIPAEQRDHVAFAEALDQWTKRVAKEMSGLRHWPMLLLRIYYSSATNWLHGYLASGGDDGHALRRAEKVAKALRNQCREKSDDRQLKQVRDQMRPFAKNLRHCVAALKHPAGATRAWRHPHRGDPLSPRLAWDHACLDSLLHMTMPGQGWDDNAVADLRLAMLTPDRRAKAQDDPCLTPLHGNPDFRDLIGLPPTEFLDLPTLRVARSAVKKAGITTAAQLLAARKRAAPGPLARRLKISPAVLDRICDVAELALVHPDLDHPEVLYVLHAIDVDSRDELLEQAQRDPIDLVRRLRAAAAEARVSNQRAVRTPWPWLRKLGVARGRVRAARTADLWGALALVVRARRRQSPS